MKRTVLTALTTVMMGLGIGIGHGQAQAVTLVAMEAQIQALKAQVASLQQQTISNTANVGGMQRNITTILQSQVWALNPFLLVTINPFEHIRGPNIYINGANFHVRNGMGNTNLTNGLGNLIVGYAEPPTENTPPVSPQRLGSHNLIIGAFNSWDAGAYAGIVAGEHNEISGEASSVLGGQQNTASGKFSVVLGTTGNNATDAYSILPVPVVGGGSSVVAQ
jgi:hypothetical protein